MAFNNFIHNTYFSWILLFVLVISANIYFRFYLDKKKRPKKTSRMIVYDAIKLIAAVFLAAFTLKIDGSVTWTIARLFVVIYIILFSEVIADVFVIIGRVIHQLVKKSELKETFKNKGIKKAIKNELALQRCVLSTLFAIIVFIYGTINAANVISNDVTYTSSKISEDHTFVFLSDIHAGASQSEKVFENVIDRIEEIKPEFVVLCGDLTDEFTEREEMVELYSHLSKLSMPVYFVFGNHDRQRLSKIAGGKRYALSELMDAINDAGIIVLEDESCMIGDDICLVGRDDAQKKNKTSIEKISGIDYNKFVLVADHRPYNFSELVPYGIDLQISGHTHGGQLFPLGQLAKLLGIESYGTFSKGNSNLYVSFGEGGWGVPFRTSGHPAFEIIHLKKK